MLADETHVALHGDDGTLADEEQSGAVFRNLMLDLASSGEFLASPEIGPLSLGQIDLVAEDAEEQVGAKHVLVAGIIHLTVVGEDERHGAHDGHTGLSTLDGSGVDIGHERIAQLDVELVELLVAGGEVERLAQRVPAVDLHPRQEEAEVQAGHLQLYGVYRHDIARGVEESAHAEIKLVEQSRTASTIVAAGGCAPMLGAGISGGVVVPVALARVLAHHHLHLLGQQYLVEVVHVLVGITVVVVAVGVLIDGACRVHLESAYTIVYEGLEVVHPVLLTALGLTGGACEQVFFGQTEVIVLAEPEAELEAHGLESSGEELEVLALLLLIGHPVGLDGEELVVPLLLGGEVVALFHPLGLQPDEVAGHVHLAEAYGIVEYLEHVFEHVGAEAHAVGPLGLQIGSAGDEGVGIDEGRHVAASHEVEVGLV